ncbi:MAG TPA: DUF5989 family protein [bacterium]|nr:DUF5989 family protein [bacterium]
MAEKPVKKKKRYGIVSEFAYFLKTHRMWWLFPVIIVILAFGAIIMLGGTELALTIYALF